MADMRSSDILAYDWANRARQILDAHKKNPEAKKAPELYPGGTFKVTEDKKPTNALYRLLSDPQLNRGLENIAEAVPEAVLGRESGNAAVDLGAANIPGIGAGAILAAGGVPGMLDVAGLGEVKTLMKGLKHASKIGEKTAKFIINHYGENGLKAVDDYIDKFPKVGNIQVQDAYKILSEGRGGQVIEMPALSGEFQGAKLLDNVKAFGVNTADEILYKMKNGNIVEDYPNLYPALEEYIRQTQNIADEGDIAEALARSSAITTAFADAYSISSVMDFIDSVNKTGSARLLESMRGLFKKAVDKNSRIMGDIGEESRPFIDWVNDYVKLQFGKTQDLEKIEAAQLRSDANKAAKQAKKAQKAAQLPDAKPSQILGARQATDVAQSANREAELAKVEADRARYQKNLEKRHEENRALTQQQQAAAAERNAATEAPIVREIEETTPAPQVMRGGPNQWRENGWSSTDHNLDYEAILGKRNLTEDEKRDAFVLDSLASHWANRLRQTSPVKEWAGRGNFEHMHTNYGMNLGREPGVADQFIADIIKNKNSGNMPGNSFRVYRNPISSNPAAKVIDVEGYDIYYPLFHKKTDEKLNQLDSRYFFDAMDPQYVIKNKKISR